MRPSRSRAGRGVAVLIGATALLGACSTSGGQPAGAPPSTAPGISVLPPPRAVGSSGGDDELVEIEDPYARSTDGVALPDPERTPGGRFEDVGATEICDVHYTQGVRQPSYNAKVSAFSGYGISMDDREVYRVDHLIPISLGGNNDEANLWPQPADTNPGAYEKDLLERQLRGLVCSDRLALETAQDAIATDWWQAYEAYIDAEIEPGTAGPEPTRPPTTLPGQVIKGGTCAVEGEVGYTEPKGVRLTCTATSAGELRWQRRS